MNRIFRFKATTSIGTKYSWYLATLETTDQEKAEQNLATCARFHKGISVTMETWIRDESSQTFTVEGEA